MMVASGLGHGFIIWCFRSPTPHGSLVVYLPVQFAESFALLANRISTPESPVSILSLPLFRLQCSCLCRRLGSFGRDRFAFRGSKRFCSGLTYRKIKNAFRDCSTVGERRDLIAVGEPGGGSKRPNGVKGIQEENQITWCGLALLLLS
jgi:hypothetical protein